MAADDTRDPNDPIDSAIPHDPKTIERRRFLQLLGAAGVYTPPALAVIATGVSPAFAQGRSQEALARALAKVQGKGNGKAAENLSSLLYSGEDSGSGSYSGEDSYEGSTSGSYSGEDSSEGSTSGSYPGEDPGEDSSEGTYSGEDSSAGSHSGEDAGMSVFYATGDTFLRFAAKNTNEGGNPLIRVGLGPITRGLVKFDRDAVMAHLPNGARVHLVLHIANNHNDWGQDDDRVVMAYPVVEDFVEGNGRQSTLPGWAAVRGTGAGATWMSPEDPDIADDRPRGATRRWQGGDSVAPATGDGAVHTNHVEGVDVSWDVTEDVIAGYGAWLLMVDEQGGPRHGNARGHGKGGDAGADTGTGGTVEYYSRQGDAARGPRLVISS